MLAVLAYTVVLISFDRYQTASLAPMIVLPLAMLQIARIPLAFAIRRLVILSPFVAMLCLAGPIFDHSLRVLWAGPWRWETTGGWLTAIDIFVKFSLSVLAVTALMCTTPFSLLLEAMRKLGLPKVLAMQLGFLYRYIFVLIDESMRVRRARDFRGAARAAAMRRLAAGGAVIGSLFVRTLERSERIHVAMCARGYRGEPHSLAHLHFHRADFVFLGAVAGYLLVCRSWQWIG